MKVIDVFLAAIGSLFGAWVMEPVTTALYDRASEEDKQRERDAGQGVAYDVAARKMAGLVGVKLDDDQVSKAGLVLHYAVGLPWAAAYVWLRRKRKLGPVAAGTAAGLSLFAVVDEGMNPTLGFTAPPQAYPVSSHLRGLVGHITFGLGMAAATELLWRLVGRR